MNQPMRLSPDSLLAHEPFVRAVVRDLLRDEHRVQDVLQETWMRALHSGPDQGGSLKGWLAKVARRLALDQRRGSARLERRERESARGEALEAVDALSARLEAQREVVDAVLTLEEPYKSVVLLAYYEQLAPQAIGERLGRSPATVRSQLSRAHEILKRRLDAHHGGDRSAWAGVLLPWAVATKSNAGLAVAAGIAVALIGAGAWVLPRMLSGGGAEASAPNQVALEMTSQPVEEQAPLSVAVVSEVLETRSEIGSAPPASASQRPELTQLPADSLRDLAVQAMRTLEKKALTPDAHFVDEQQSLLALPDTGVAKVMLRTQGRSPYDGLILPRGAGTYFSFATLSHDYDREPDIEFENGYLHAGFYGAAVGFLVEVGDVDLLRYSPRVSVLPFGNPGISRQEWELLFARPETDDEAGARKLQAAVRALPLGPVRAKERTAYLARVWSPGEHDHLVALRTLALDKDSVTLAWRVLERFPHAAREGKGTGKPEWDHVPASPEWIELLEKHELISLIHEIRAHAEPRLLGVPAELQQQNEWRISSASVRGFFRLLPYGRYEPVLEAPGGGTRYSFEKRRHTDRGHQLEGTEEWLSSEFLMPLGKLDSAEYQGVFTGQCPARIVEKARESWSFLWTTPSVYTQNDGTSGRGMKPEDGQRWRDELRSGFIGTVAEQSYLMRAIDSDADTDRLLLLTVLENSDNGATLCWRELKRFDR